MCIVIGKHLCSRGALVARQEVQRLAGDDFVDFCMADDGFGEDCYAFVKCKIPGNFMEQFRRSSNVVTVLSSYDSPTYIDEKEVIGFVEKDDGDAVGCLGYGDIVTVLGDTPYTRLKGVVVLAGCEESQVMLRFHTVNIRVWIPNLELQVDGSAFKYVKIPETEEPTDRKYPVLKETEIVIKQQPSWGAYRQS